MMILLMTMIRAYLANLHVLDAGIIDNTTGNFKPESKFFEKSYKCFQSITTQGVQQKNL